MIEEKQIQRTFIPGDEWVYYKFYTGIAMSDELIDMLLPVIQQFLNDSIIDKWFFVRYSDPDHHLRIRFHAVDSVAVTKIIVIINNFISNSVQDSIIWKIQIDSYNREIERYGYDLIDFAEDLFYHDSTMVVKMIHHENITDGESSRWLFALISVNALIDNFHLSQDKKINVLKKMRDAYADEFGMNRTLKRQLDAKYRENFSLIERALNRNGLQEYLSCLIDERTSYNIEITGKIFKRYMNVEISDQLFSFLTSVIHMSMNRTFSSKQRLNEMLIYDFLYRFYVSARAQQKYNKKSQEIV